MSGLVTGGFKEEPKETLWQIYDKMMMKQDNIPFGQCQMYETNLNMTV